MESARPAATISHPPPAPTFTNVDLPMPLGPRIPIRDCKSTPKLMSRNRIFSREYPNVMSFDCRIGNCSIGGYFGHFSRPYIHELEMQHRIVDNRGNGVHLLLQLLDYLEFTLHLSTMEGVSSAYGARLALTRNRLMKIMRWSIWPLML